MQLYSSIHSDENCNKPLTTLFSYGFSAISPDMLKCSSVCLLSFYRNQLQVDRGSLDFNIKLLDSVLECLVTFEEINLQGRE
jgi:hypothetical protein